MENPKLYIGTDNLPIAWKVIDEDEKPVDVTGATATITIVTSNPQKTERFVKSCIIDPTTHSVRYYLRKADIPIAGNLKVQFAVTLVNGQVLFSEEARGTVHKPL